MGWDNPPVPWRELERRLSWDMTRRDGSEPAGVVRGRFGPQPAQDDGPPWAELHCHSSYSFLDGASSPAELVAEAARQGVQALALTDHDGMYGVAQFAQAAARQAEQTGISLGTIFGAELSVSPGGRPPGTPRMRSAPRGGTSPTHRRSPGIFSEVSPKMHWEFALQHDLRWLQRWGLTYYGCCEPLSGKIDLLRRIPNLRKISTSPWCKIKPMLEQVGGDYVLSRKPNPAIFAEDTWHPDRARADLVEFVETAAGRCHIEFIMKDISTVRYEPQRLWDWSRIAMEVAEEFAR